jgi:hypothetical protein
VADSTAHLVIGVGSLEFSSNPAVAFPGFQEGLVGEVTDELDDLHRDRVVFDAAGDETTFAPFLTGFARQKPSLQPRGLIQLGFDFPFTQLSSDAFPTSIDRWPPLASLATFKV